MLARFWESSSNEQNIRNDIKEMPGWRGGGYQMACRCTAATAKLRTFNNSAHVRLAIVARLL